MGGLVLGADPRSSSGPSARPAAWDGGLGPAAPPAAPRRSPAVSRGSSMLLHPGGHPGPGWAARVTGSVGCPGSGGPPGGLSDPDRSVAADRRTRGTRPAATGPGRSHPVGRHRSKEHPWPDDTAPCRTRTPRGPSRLPPVAGPVGALPRLLHDPGRLHDRLGGDAGDHARAARRHQLRHLGHQRLPARLRRAAAGHRPARRPVRPEERLPVGLAVFTAGLAVVRADRRHRAADRWPASSRASAPR